MIVLKCKNKTLVLTSHYHTPMQFSLCCFYLLLLFAFLLLSAKSFQLRLKQQSSRRAYLKQSLELSSSRKSDHEGKGEQLSNLVSLSEEERLQKVISRAGVASRRGAEKMILDGRVFVNGKIITELGSPRPSPTPLSFVLLSDPHLASHFSCHDHLFSFHFMII